MTDYTVRPTPSLPDDLQNIISSTLKKDRKVKVASRDLLLDPLPFPLDLATSMTIDDIGALQLINTARHDLITGNNINYKSIGKLSNFNSRYTPSKILALSDGTPEQFGKFSINIDYYIPVYDTQAETLAKNGANYYIDNNQNLVLEFVNLRDGEYVEVQIVSQGNIYDIL